MGEKVDMLEVKKLLRDRENKQIIHFLMVLLEVPLLLLEKTEHIMMGEQDQTDFKLQQ